MKVKRIEEKGAIAILVVVTILMFIMILMGTYMAIVNLKKSQLESDIRIQQLYGGDVENIEQIYEKLIDKSGLSTNNLKEGEYIGYNSGTNGKIMCRVLYPVDSKYGLQIISDKNVKEVALGLEETNGTLSKTSYNNAIETLNKEAEAYINSAYAEDARCVGSVPTVENGKFVNKNSETAGPFLMEFEYNGSTSVDCKGTDRNYTIDQKQMLSGNVNLCLTGENYWLASRYVDYDELGCSFRVRNMNINGDLTYRSLYYIYKNNIRNRW